MKKLSLLFAILISAFTLFAQYGDKAFYLVDSLTTQNINDYDLQLIDSTLTNYHDTDQDTTKIKLLAFLAENVEDQTIWPKYNQLLFDLSETQLNSLAKNDNQLKHFYLGFKNSALNNFGYLYLMQGKVDIALKYYEKSKDILEIINNKSGLAAYYNSIGYIHINQGSIKKGLDLLHKSLKIKEKLDDLDAIATSLTNIGYVYKNQKEHDKALEYFEKSLNIRELLEDKSGAAMCLGHLAALYEAQGLEDKAYENYYKALQISQETSNDYYTAFHLHNIGAILVDKKQYANATQYHEQGLDLRRKISDPVGIVNSLCALGEIKLKLGDVNKAKKYAHESMELAQQLNYPKEISFAAQLLQQIYRKQNKWKEAFAMYELQIIMRDSLNNAETQKAAITQQMQYIYEKEKLADSLEFATQQAIKDLVIKEGNAKIEVQKAESKVLYGGIIILVLLVGAALWAFRSKKRDNEIISNQKVLVEEKNKEIVDSIKYAKRIQTAILPPDHVVKEHLEKSFILYKPKDIVAGDFYWLESVPGGDNDDSKVLFAAADCTGHGVPGAMVSVVCNNALNRSVREHGLTNPGLILDKTREIVVHEFEKSNEKVNDGMDIALCMIAGTKLTYAGANNPLWMIRDNNLIETKANKQPIGKFDNFQPYTTHEYDLQKGDTIYLFSDGYVDQFGGPKDKKFKAAALKKLLLSIQGESMQEQQQILNNTFNNWKGKTEQIDDVCVIGVRI